ncbi:D-Ala-D-Ala carboxypeptidase family metallohydrolase [Primorskyibacter sp. S187A]|uniref:D-Ala-D-Ala carboxypeptidase family metallohydrolase n=1 Tax=Primorskyibacter sp. S187A TaxID=3415130 RepID=UPI003C7CC8E5
MLILKNSDAGYKNPVGSIVLQVQRALRDSGHSPGVIDGEFGGGTEKALRAYQKSVGLPESGSVDLTTWTRLTGHAAPPSIFERALAITASFEGHGYTKIAGNFDGALLTWGIIGYTMGGGSLQKLMARITQYDPSAIDDAFGALAEPWKEVLGQSKTKQRSFANEISVAPKKYKVKAPWSEAFHRLGQNPQAQRAQNDLARELYWTRAQKIMAREALDGELGACLAFDIAVQNGSIDTGDRKHLNRLLSEAGPVSGEAYRACYAEAMALGSKQAYQNDVRSRKMTLATGSGKVHGANYKLVDWGLADRVVAAEADETVVSSTSGWATASDTMVLTAPAQSASGDDEADFMAFIKSLGLKNFKPYEFLIKGDKNANPESAAYQTNTNPPRELWPNIAPTARVLDILRGRIDAPIRTISVYRSPAYNVAIGGAKKSQHTMFRAVDFVAQGNSTPLDWANTLRSMRAEGLFLGGIGTYSTFVHIDTRGFNADW